MYWYLQWSVPDVSRGQERTIFGHDVHDFLAWSCLIIPPYILPHLDMFHVFSLPKRSARPPSETLCTTKGDRLICQHIQVWRDELLSFADPIGTSDKGPCVVHEERYRSVSYALQDSLCTMDPWKLFKRVIPGSNPHSLFSFLHAFHTITVNTPYRTHQSNMSTEHAVRSAGQKVYIEPGSAAYDPLQNFIQQSLNLGEIAETLSRNFLSEVIDRRDVDAKFPQLTEARFEGLKAKRRGVGVDPTYHLKDMPSRIVAEFLDDARRTGYYLTNFARSHDDPRDRYKATTVYDYVRGRQELEIPEKSPSNLRVAVTSWNTALQILQAALGTPEDQSEFE